MARPVGAGQALGELVGRKDALQVLDSELRVAVAGAPRIVWVGGEGGVGKTTLLRHFLAELEVPCEGVWADCAEEEAVLPFAFVDQLGAALTHGGGRAATWPDLTELTPLRAGALVLAGVGAIDGPAVLVLEDLQWCDRESATALFFALRRLQHEPLLVVITTRPDPSEGLGESWARLLRDEHRVRRLDVGGFSSSELQDLARVVAGAHLSRGGAERLRAHTGGHPMHARALLEELGPAAFDRPDPVLPAPRSLAATVLARAASLPAEARALAGALAVLGPAPLGTVAAVGGVTDTDAAVAALDALQRAHLVEEQVGGDIAFRHSIVRGAVYNDLALVRRRELHLAAAAVVDATRSLDHRATAAVGPAPELAAELEKIGSAELEEGRLALAERHLRRAADLSARSSDRDRRFLAAMEAIAANGDLARNRTLRAEVERCGDSAHRSFVLGLVEFADNRFDAARARYGEAAQRLEAFDEDTAVLARARAGLAISLMLLGRLDEAVEPARRASSGGAGWAAGLAHLALATSLASRGSPAEVRAVAEGAGLEATPDAELLRAILASWGDDLGASAALLSHATRPDQRSGSPRMLVLGLSNLADVRFRLGSWDEALVGAELTVSIARDTDQRFALAQAHAVASLVQSCRGHVEAAEAHHGEIANLVALAPTLGGRAWLSVASVALARARNDPEAMLEGAVDLLDGPVRAGLERSAQWRWRVLAAEALLASGAVAEAERRVDGLEAMLGRWGLSSVSCEVARLRGWCAELRGDRLAARTAYEAGLRWGDHLPFSFARLQMALGRLLRGSGDARGAMKALRRAHESLSHLDARPFAATCEDELRLCGVPVQRSGGDPLALTSAEFSVAHLVGRGLTNRQAAAELYVSVKTVEYHLGHVYAKLGIGSRRELPDQLKSIEMTSRRSTSSS